VTRLSRRAGLAALMAAALPSWPTLGAPTGRRLSVAVGDSLAAAVAAAQDGDAIELEAGVHRAQAAVVLQRRLRLHAVGGTAVLQAQGAHAEGKALLVLRDGDFEIEGLEFRGARVPAGNGAGIRFERGRLALRRCRFFDNEMGLLSSNLGDTDLSVEDCEFGQAPRHEGLLHHLLYVGRMRSLRLTGSRFNGGWRGDLVKSRAAYNWIEGNRLIDGDEGEASYELDLPNGGQAWVIGNVFGQGPRPQNPALLSFGAEGQPHARSALRVAHNSFVNEAGQPALFVRHWTERLDPGAAPPLCVNNLLLGTAAESAWPAGDGNVWRALEELDRERWPQRVALRAGVAPLPGVAAAPVVDDQALAPAHEPADPLGLRALAAPAQWRPGAFQS
jgi:hypothetical protein